MTINLNIDEVRYLLFILANDAETLLEDDLDGADTAIELQYNKRIQQKIIDVVENIII